MLRRVVSNPWTAAAQTRLFRVADVKLERLLPTKSARIASHAFSVNDLIKQYRLDFPLLAEDQTLVAWATNEASLKEMVMPGFAKFDSDFHVQEATITAKLFARNNEALKALRSLGITNLEQFGRRTHEERRKVGVALEFLEESLQEAEEKVHDVRELRKWLDPQVDAFKKRIDALNSGVHEPKPYSAHLNMMELTHRHTYADGQRMLGSDRKKTLQALLGHAFPKSEKKEDNPISYLVAAPRQGKSLMLDEVVANAASRGKNYFGVAISFNSATPLTKPIDCVRDVRSQFWGRVVYSLYRAMFPMGSVPQEEDTGEGHMSFGAFTRLPFFRSIDEDVAFPLADKLGLKRVVIAADEISKVTTQIDKWRDKDQKELAMTSLTVMYAERWSLLCSGFTMYDAHMMSTYSGRDTKREFLFTLTSDTRGEFEQMAKYLEKSYPGDAFTPARRGLYEIVKNVPGYCGLWIENRDKFINKVEGYLTDISGIEDLHPPMIGAISNILSANPHLFSDYWRAVANRKGDALKVVHHGVLENLELIGAVLAASLLDKRRYLSPLVYAHPSLSCAREYDLIFLAVEKLHARGQWTIMGKGKALELVIQVKLALTAAYVNDPIARGIMATKSLPIVTSRTLIERLCGERHVIVPGAHTFDEDLPAEFPDYGGIEFPLANVAKSEVEASEVEASDVEATNGAAKSEVEASEEEKSLANTNGAVTSEAQHHEVGATEKAIVKKVSAFPAVWSKKRDKNGNITATKEKQAKRLAENIAALNSAHFSVLSPQCIYNVGCDVAMFFRVGKNVAVTEDNCREKVLFLIEAKYHSPTTWITDEDVSMKALDSLNGVLPYVIQCNVRRVCFVFCNTSFRVAGKSLGGDETSRSQPKRAPFLMQKEFSRHNNNRFKTLSGVMGELRRLGCTTSLHTVWNEKEWRNLLDSLYLIIPDTDENPRIRESENPRIGGRWSSGLCA
ncbi:Hypothetical protein, putative [Bodo saltans]|uniref:Uncharacterized protein n=1 Tax=Bodo saltans TaxID=75058 RepID=A0A0S4J5C6_BODSA|nr:Hypothetical protein, putative [Bodo saltans]|eukprot:CUG81445.1 Hypothetical protein, putative [Bodo saltans]